MNRRDFFQRVLRSAALGAAWTVAGRAASDVVSGAVAPGDTGVPPSVPVKFPAMGATVQAYLAKPATNGWRSAIVIVPGNNLLRGGDAALRGAAVSYAEQGYLALALDPLSRRGGVASFADPEAACVAAASITHDQKADDITAARKYLERLHLIAGGGCGKISVATV